MFIVNASNRYTIAMTDIEQGNWKYYIMYISRVIYVVMQEMGYSEDQIGQYFKMSGDTTVTKTHGRKSVGGINRMVCSERILAIVYHCRFETFFCQIQRNQLCNIFVIVYN